MYYFFFINNKAKLLFHFLYINIAFKMTTSNLESKLHSATELKAMYRLATVSLMETQ